MFVYSLFIYSEGKIYHSSYTLSVVLRCAYAYAKVEGHRKEVSVGL